MVLNDVERCENMKKKLFIIGIVICVLIALFYLFVISGAFLMLTYFAPNPPEPEIRYGEFPFVITYEVDGEIKTIEDTVICEYDGIEWTNSGSKERKWKSYLKSGNKGIVLLKVDDGEMSYEISTTAELPEYYMNDHRYGNDREDYERMLHDERYLGYTEIKNDKIVVKSISIEKEEVYERFKLRIIERKYSKPIENKFE